MHCTQSFKTIIPTTTIILIGAVSPLGNWYKGPVHMYMGVLLKILATQINHLTLASQANSSFLIYSFILMCLFADYGVRFSLWYFWVEFLRSKNLMHVIKKNCYPYSSRLCIEVYVGASTTTLLWSDKRYTQVNKLNKTVLLEMVSQNNFSLTLLSLM